MSTTASSTTATTTDDQDALTGCDLKSFFIDTAYVLRTYRFAPHAWIVSRPTETTTHAHTHAHAPTATCTREDATTTMTTSTATPAPAITIELEAYMLHQASPAFDLTGQIMWPATHLLAAYLLSPTLSPVLAHATHDARTSIAYELGAGAGLISLMLARMHAGVRTITITDHNPTVLDLLRTNVEHARKQVQPISTTLHVEQLEWGALPAPLQPIRDRLDAAGNANVNDDWLADAFSSTPDLLVGSDLVYSITGAQALIRTAASMLRLYRDVRRRVERAAQAARGTDNASASASALLRSQLQQRRSRAVFALSYLTRWRNVDDALFAALREDELEWREAPLHELLPSVSAADNEAGNAAAASDAASNAADSAAAAAAAAAATFASSAAAALRDGHVMLISLPDVA